MSDAKYTLTSFFGTPSNRTRSKSGKADAGDKRRLKAPKEVVAKKSKQQIESGMQEAEFSVANQKMSQK
jgi:hypothetical protein